MVKLFKSMRGTVLAGSVALGGLGAFCLSNAPAPAAPAEKEAKEERHPHIHKAIHELKEAKKELKEADHDFGGHRVEAIEAIDKAVKQLEEAVKHDKK
jgi:hypothetical protein